MPRTLSADRFTSPLTRLLDSSSAQRAVCSTDLLGGRVPATSAERTSGDLHHAQASPSDTFIIKRECTHTPASDEALTRLTDLIRRATGARINTSCAVRSLLLALGTAWPRLEEELRAIAPLRLPSNAAGNQQRRAALERTLASALFRAIRSSSESP